MAKRVSPGAFQEIGPKGLLAPGNRRWFHYVIIKGCKVRANTYYLRDYRKDLKYNEH